MKGEFPIQVLCDLLEVSRSGYYDWVQRQDEPGPRAREEQLLRAKVIELHQESRQTYGSPRICQALSRTGARHGRNRISRIMREEGLCGRQQKRYRVVTTDSKHDLPIAPNHLAQAAPPTGPNQQWVGDITYIHTEEGWLYLAATLHPAPPNKAARVSKRRDSRRGRSTASHRTTLATGNNVEEQATS